MISFARLSTREYYCVYFFQRRGALGMSVKNVAVLGGGSFGTVIANIIANNNHTTLLWMRDSEQVKMLNEKHENTVYLPGYKLHRDVVATDDLEAAVRDVDLIFVAVPSGSFRQVVQQMKPLIHPDTILVSSTKGIEAPNFKLMSQILEEEIPAARIAVMSGPNLAKEIAANSPTGTVVASHEADTVAEVQHVLKSDSFRVYANGDMLGVELGGSLKNIYAIIAGLADAVGMGNNSNAMLVTRSLTEMARFGVELGADPMTFLGLSGVGDLIATCSTPLSRNFRIGKALGEGRDIESVISEMDQVAEGVNTLKQVKEKADQLGVHMPLVNGLYEIMYNNQTVDHIIKSIMLETQGLDVEFAARKTLP